LESKNDLSGGLEIYRKIAKGLKTLKEDSLALEVCERALKKYPKNSGLYILKGQIQIAVSRESGRADFLKPALGDLEKALKLDPQNYLAKILASQILVKGRAYNKAKAMLNEILGVLPDDEKAVALLSLIEKNVKPKTGKAKPPQKTSAAATSVAPKSAEPEPGAKHAKEALAETEPEKPDVKVAVAPSIHNTEDKVKPDDRTATEKMDDTEPDSDQWIIDDNMVIESINESDNDAHIENMVAKLTMFSRLEGLEALFLIDSNGQPIKTINKAKLDENIIPSLIFNLFKVSVAGVRRTGHGSFQRGTLVSPIGVIVIANVFYATLACVVDTESNLTAVETRIQRYMDEVAT